MFCVLLLLQNQHMVLGFGEDQPLQDQRYVPYPP